MLMLVRWMRLPDEVVIAFEDPVDMMKMLTVERLRLLSSLREVGEMRVGDWRSGWGGISGRFRRDVNAMREHGLVLTKYVVNAGHRRNLELKAAI